MGGEGEAGNSNKRSLRPKKVQDYKKMLEGDENTLNAIQIE